MPHQAIIGAVYTVGGILCAISYWAVKPWQLSMVLIQLLPMTLLLLGMLLLLE